MVLIPQVEEVQRLQQEEERDSMALSFARTQSDDKSLIAKSKKAVTRTSVKGGNNLSTTIQSMVSMAEAKLRHHKGDYILLRDKQSLMDYIARCNDHGIAALDTETTGLNPLLIDIVGLCLYVPGQKSAYVPINHKSYITGARTSDQLTEDEVRECLMEASCKWVMHNAKYDIRVCRHTLGVDLECEWDTMLAAYCIDENESHALKDLHLKYCDSTDTESLTFGKLFDGITFDNVPINIAYLYAAGDTIKTFELYEKQQTILNRRTLPGPYNVFKNIEMPVLKVVCDMEDRGVCLDTQVVQALQEKYHKLQSEAYDEVYKALSMYDEQIENFKMKNVKLAAKLHNPISISSSTQLAIFFYDILGLKSPDGTRGTGEDILKEFAKGKEKNLCEAILKVRTVDKLVSTYIDNIPELVLKDGRIHCTYNQYGAKTGRFSSQDPNMQNIPSHNKDIRKMFRAQNDYVLIGGDFSQQEPKLTAHLSNDQTMTKAFLEGKDIYSTIAALSFNVSYEDCLEFRPDGTTNKAGKERRTQAKSIVLGILYGRSTPSIAEQLGVTAKKAQEIFDKVMKSFPALKKFMEDSQNNARTKGYVETAWGRRRHLPDMQLDEYEFKSNGKAPVDFDPLSFNSNISTDIPEKVKKEFLDKLRKAYGWQKKAQIKEEAEHRGITIKDNGGFIAQAERQCVNARVQGSAADLTKIAMIKIHQDSRLKELDFHLILQVHDEVIGECPRRNAREVRDRLQDIMVHCADEFIKIPMKCDIDVTTNWYGEEVAV